MQKIKAFVPHVFTLGNLFCGCLGIIYAFGWKLDWAAYMVFLAAFLDFFDGFFARILKVHSELGKQLDSLADMVSFGVVPGMVMFQWLKYLAWSQMVYIDKSAWGASGFIENFPAPWYCYVALMIPIFSCFRLAKFNLDTRQLHGFIGLPTPANAIFFVSMVLVVIPSLPFETSYLGLPSPTMEKNLPVGDYLFVSKAEQTSENTSGIALTFLKEIVKNRSVILFLIILFSFLLVSPLPLFALKFKNFSWNSNKIRYLFLALALVLLICFWLTAIPFIVILYLVLSIVNNIFKITV